jgi:hypothetical protein
MTLPGRAYAARHELHLVEGPVSTSGNDSPAGASAPPRPSAAQLLAAKNTRPIKSLDRAVHIFGSDDESEDFLAFS